MILCKYNFVFIRTFNNLSDNPLYFTYSFLISEIAIRSLLFFFYV